MTDDQLREIPLPCPFCGGEASLFNNFTFKDMVVVECDECKADSAYCATEAEAIAAWNRRTAVPLLCEEVGRLRAENAKMRDALEKIERWDRWDSFPATWRFWDKEKTDPMSYGAEFGSNGERDYMRGLARSALSALPDERD